MSTLIARIIIIAVFLLAGYFYGLKYGFIAQGLVSGIFLGFITVVVEMKLRKVSFGSVLGGLFGLATGLLFANLLLFPLHSIIVGENWTLSAFALNGILGYGGLFVGLYRGKNLTIPAIMRLFKGQELEEGLKILDTSVIIDGRIAMS